MLKLPLKSIAIYVCTQKVPKPILSLKKCHENPLLADNYLFPHCAYWQSVADMDVLIKEMATVQMDYLVNFQPWSFQDVTGVKRDILVILDRPREQLWGCAARCRRRWQQGENGTHQRGSNLQSTFCTWSEKRPTDMGSWKKVHRSQTQKFQWPYMYWW